MNTRFLDELVSKYEDKGLLIDANLLLMYFLGLYDVTAMCAFKRTRGYSEEDWRLMKRLTSLFKKIVTTPNVITEVSNLAGQLGESVNMKFFNHMVTSVHLLTEDYCPRIEACTHRYFARCGLTDCALMQLAKKKYLVVTDDFRLAQIMSQSDNDVINFNHVRSVYLLGRH